MTISEITVHPGEHTEQVTATLTAPMLARLDPAEFRARGCHSVTLSQPIAFGAEPEFDVRFIRFIRQALSYLLEVDWRLATPGPAEVSVLCHLPPPAAAGPDPAARYASQWQSQYGFAHCYYRLGPQFVHIVDVRDTGNAARFVLDDPAAVEAFLRLTDAVRLSDVPQLAADLADQLAEAGLLLRLGDWATILPFRLVRWPLPCTAV